MYCTNCGKVIEETEKFCKYCGFQNEDYQEEKQSEKPKATSSVQDVTEETPAETSSVQDAAVEMQPETSLMQEEAVEVTPTETSSVQDVTVEAIPEMLSVQNETLEAPAQASAAQEEIVETPIEPSVTHDGASNLRSEQPVKLETHLKKTSVGRIIGSVFLSIFAFVIILILISTVFVKNVLSEETISTATQEIDYSNIELGDLLQNSNLDMNIEESDTTVDIIYNALSESSDLDISKNELEEILEESSFSEYISDKLTQYSRYILTGEKSGEITPDEIVSLVEDNKDVIERAIGEEITTDELDLMENRLDSDYQEVFDALSVEKIDQTLGDNDLTRIHAIFSDEMLILVIIFTATLLALIIILIGYLHKKVRAPFVYAGIPTLIAGVTFSAAMLVMMFSTGTIFDVIGIKLRVLEPVILSFITKGIIIGAITAGAGLFMIICYVVMKKVEHSRKTSAVMSAG